MAATGMIVATSACSTTSSPIARGAGATAGGGPEAPAAATVAVLNEVFRSNASPLKDNAGTYCISTGPDIESGDADVEVLAGLRQNPKVKPRSACEIAPGGNGVFDRQTRKPSLIFSVATAACSSSTNCLIFGGYYEGNLSSQTNRYLARLVDGAWRVSLDEMGPVS